MSKHRIETPLRDLELLHELYINQRKTRKALAEEFGLKEWFVKDLVALLPTKVPNRGRFKQKLVPVSDATIAKMYIEDLMVIQEIAKALNSTYWVVQEALKREGVERRKGVAKYTKGWPNTGNKTSYETRKKQSLAKLKIPESEWKGFTEPACKKRNKSPEWNAWRKKVFHRDHYKCKMCGIGKHLQGHHIRRRAQCPDSVFTVSNGITLCFSCHSSIFLKEPEFERFFDLCLRNYEIYQCGDLGQTYVPAKEIVEL